ncbi:MAG: hypothetical protein M3381_08700 [Actinomycetota bacterium]|nr:hypothetical protein [Actinomycetota bacterium]
MSPTKTAPRLRAYIGSAGLLGVAGSLACTAAMVLPVIGAAGATASMAEMAGAQPDGLLGVLIEYGPIILITSILLVAAGLSLRRPAAVVPALAAGAVMYWGMYAQPSYPMMYLTLIIGFGGWLITYLWTRRKRPQQATS